MNEILQKRIYEAAENHEQCYNVGEEHGYLYTHKGDIKEAVIYGADFALQNQWISVEEALPEFKGNFSDYYIIRTEDGWCDVTMYYRTSEKEYWWNFEKVKVTHWMPIPEIKGGEK